MDGTIGVVTVRDLSRSPAKVLDRILKGERLVVARHGRPAATLQPITGSFFERGAEEVALKALTLAQQESLVKGVTSIDRLVIRSWETFEDGSNQVDGLRDLVLQGFAKKTERGIVLTGRGHILRERLLALRV